MKIFLTIILTVMLTGQVGAQSWSIKSVADKGGPYPVEVPDVQREATEAYLEDGNGQFTSFGCVEKIVKGTISTSIYIRIGNRTKFSGDELDARLNFPNIGSRRVDLSGLKYSNGAYYGSISLSSYALILSAELLFVKKVTGEHLQTVIIGWDWQSTGRDYLTNIECLKRRK
ncbi:MAG: hypothetical protein GY952_13230 [Rhodobacteraceae bacterium]|nr:hypothetical protein [Paracoccaceae bacterium]